MDQRGRKDLGTGQEIGPSLEDGQETDQETSPEIGPVIVARTQHGTSQASMIKLAQREAQNQKRW